MLNNLIYVYNFVTVPILNHSANLSASKDIIIVPVLWTNRLTSRKKMGSYIICERSKVKAQLQQNIRCPNILHFVLNEFQNFNSECHYTPGHIQTIKTCNPKQIAATFVKLVQLIYLEQFCNFNRAIDWNCQNYVICAGCWLFNSLNASTWT
jgi:hypothetical protein